MFFRMCHGFKVGRSFCLPAVERVKNCHAGLFRVVNYARDHAATIALVKPNIVDRLNGSSVLDRSGYREQKRVERFDSENVGFRSATRDIWWSVGCG